MPYQINIINFKVNSMTQNSNINIGATVQNSHTSNLKLVGTNFSIGNFSPSRSQMNTGSLEQDINDQGQTENPS